jgi:uncharacterized protein YndB with AHSA1/START domain
MKISGQYPHRCIALAAVLAALPAGAEVVSVQSSGFLVRHEILIDAVPARVYSGLVAVADWWDPAHTWSGEARNLSMDARPGGCFCEELPGGGVQHLEVVYAAPGKMLRLYGGLGPLQDAGLAGSMTWRLAAADRGTKLTLTYSVGGFYEGGFAAIAPAVNMMLEGQIARLKSYVETGFPEVHIR